MVGVRLEEGRLSVGFLSAADLAARPDFALGAASVSPSTRVVRGPGGEVSLEPRTMQVLVVLADAAGSVVTRAALFSRCWGNAAVGDDSLNRAIADIRRAARIAGGFAIATVPRTGYRLTAEPSASATTAPSRRVLMVAAPAAAVAAIAGVGLWQVRSSRTRAEVATLMAQADQATRTGVPEGHRRAVQRLSRVVELEPRHAAAWGRLAQAQASLVEVSAPGEAGPTVAAVQEAARRALALDPRQADALGALAVLPPYFGDWLAAERRMDGVLAVAPAHLPTLDARSFLHVSVGRALEGSRGRVAFTPASPPNAEYLYRLIYAYWMLGRVDEADRAADRVLQLWPKHPGAWFGRLWSLAFTGRAARALAHVEDAAARPDLPDWMVESLRASMVALESRRPADVARATARLLAEVSRGPSLSVNAFLIFSGLGEIDRAFDVANAYLLETGPLMASVRWRPGQVSVADQRRRKTNMLFNPVSAPVRADPRFLELTRRIGLADYWAKAGVTPDFLAGG
jgi:DNA-binding winged helix-turn-helix (wHTH) protein